MTAEKHPSRPTVPCLTLAEMTRRRARGEPLPPGVERALRDAERQVTAALADFAERLRSALTAALSDVEAWLRSGEPAADWALLVMPDVSGAEYVDAAHRILGRIKGSPIYRKRWRDNLSRLRLAAENLKPPVTPKAAAAASAKHNSWQAAIETVQRVQLAEMSVPEIRAGHDDLIRQFRVALSRLIMDDMLGADWRRRAVEGQQLATQEQWRAAAKKGSRREAGLEDANAGNEWLRVEARMALERVGEAAGLSPTQRMTFDAWLPSGGDITEMTRLLSEREGHAIPRGTVRKRKTDLEQRLKRAANLSSTSLP